MLIRSTLRENTQRLEKENNTGCNKRKTMENLTKFYLSEIRLEKINRHRQTGQQV
jgi:hypothetical protein